MLLVTIPPARFFDDINNTFEQLKSQVSFADLDEVVADAVKRGVHEVLRLFVERSIMKGADVDDFMSKLEEEEIAKVIGDGVELDKSDLKKIYRDMSKSAKSADDSNFPFLAQIYSNLPDLGYEYTAITSEVFLVSLTKATIKLANRLLTESTIESFVDDINAKFGKIGYVESTKFDNVKLITNFY